MNAGGQIGGGGNSTFIDYLTRQHPLDLGPARPPLELLGLVYLAGPRAVITDMVDMVADAAIANAAVDMMFAPSTLASDDKDRVVADVA